MHFRKSLACDTKLLADGVVSNLPQRPSVAADHFPLLLLPAATSMCWQEILWKARSHQLDPSAGEQHLLGLSWVSAILLDFFLGCHTRLGLAGVQ